MTTPLNLHPEPWMTDALCAQVGGDEWFPEKGKSGLEAKRVCNGAPGREPCPARADCLIYALDNDIREGIWGGLSQWERGHLRRGAA